MSPNTHSCSNSEKFKIANWRINSRQIIATQRIDQNEVIFSDAPIASALIGNLTLPTAPWDIVSQILATKSIQDLFKKLDLHVTKFQWDSDDADIVNRLSKQYKIPEYKIQKMYFSVCTNNINFLDSSENNAGYGIFPILSFANHSCNSNSKITSGDVSKKELILTSLRLIEPGESITWSYIDPRSGFTKMDTITRKTLLKTNYNFTCICERCRSELRMNVS